MYGEMISAEVWDWHGFCPISFFLEPITLRCVSWRWASISVAWFFWRFFLVGGKMKFLFSLKNSLFEWKHLKMEGFKTFSCPFGGVSSYFQGLLLLGKSECKDVFFSGRRVDISWIFMVPNLPPTCFGENFIQIPCELPCWTEGTISAWTSSGSICVLAERTCVPARRHAPFSNWWFQLGIF